MPQRSSREQDYAAYVEARGPTLVRCLVVRGLPLPRAQSAATEAFADLRGDWDELVHWGDVDEALFAPGEIAALLDDESVPPPAPFSYDRVRAVLARRRRRQWRIAGAQTGAASIALVVATLVAGSAQPPPRKPDHSLGRVAVAAVPNDTGVVWWADGTLHLADVALEVGDVRRLVAAGGAAAYLDGQGRLVAAYPDGHRTLLGRPTSGSSLVSSPVGLVAWVDASRPAVQRLVVWDLTAERQVAGVVVSGLRTEPTGFDGGWLTFRIGTTDWVWNPRGGDPRQTGDGAPKADGDEWTSLVDTVVGSRLEQVGWTMRVVHTRTGRMTYFPGFVDGALSPDGRRVLARPVGGEPQLYDAHSGERLDTWYPGGWRLLDATFVDDDRVAWLTERDDGRAFLVVCGSPGAPMDCSTPEDLHAEGTPVIARDTTG
ncbi:hypothetical protein ISU07_10100 [Nocardioides islandensis]|uniref:WD40 repeat domain-containing protein n=1 Tax=Nocardioides islandensis TaxID=433663 RepID=A0A930VEH7_9ACTN|nr:hypothetical protein [Nocardioides islandensis]MBF4763478.1 hypothetical protein [Nocardioides islandensis]